MREKGDDKINSGKEKLTQQLKPYSSYFLFDNNYF